VVTGMDDDELVAAMPRLKGYAFNLTRNKQDAEDLVQDAVMKALVNAHYYRSENKPASWLCEIAFRLFVDRYRQHKRWRRAVKQISLDEIFPVRTHGFWDDAPQETQVRLDEIWSCLFGMTPAHREAVLMAAAGYTLQQSAKRAGVPVGTMRSRVHYGRARLAEVTA